MAAEDTKVVRIIVDSSAAVDGSRAVTRALEQMEKAQEKAGSTLERMEAGLGRMGGYLKAQVVMQVTEMAGRLVGMAKAALEAAGGLDELAEQLGVSNRALQALQFSAVQNGLKLEQLETGIMKFSQKMGEAANGSKDMIDALTRIGVKNLDLQGQLRPTEDLLQDVAAAIMAIDDPAKRSAAAVDFFGKAGGRMLPMLADIASGTDLMAAKMERAGAYVFPETVKKLDELGDASERAGLRWRATFANGAASLLDFYEKNKGVFSFLTMGLSNLVEMMAKNPQAVTEPLVEGFRKARLAIEDWYDKAHGVFDQMVIAGGKFVGSFMGLFSVIPTQLGKLFVDGMNNALDALESGLNKLASGFANSWLGKKLGADGTGVTLGRLSGGGASNGDLVAGAQAGGEAMVNRLKGAGYGQDYGARRAQQREIDFADWFARQEASAAGYVPNKTTGAGTSTPTGGGGTSPEEKYKKLEQQLMNTAAAQNTMTAAALAGSRAFDEAKATVDAQNKVLEIFGQQLDDNDPRLTRIRDLLLDIERGKAAESFAVATTELQKQNVVLEAEIRLRDQSVEVRSRELGMIKAQQEAEKGGAAITSDMVEARRAAIEQNEKLKAQGEELKRSNEIWTAPLKSALESIQRTGADMWDQILEKGKISGEEFVQVFSKMARRAAAELLALATIRPVIQFVVAGLGSAGLVSPATASSLGYGGGAGSVFSGGGGMGGGGLGGMGGGGLGGFGSSLSGSLGSFGQWLNTPFTGPYAGLSPSAMEGVPMLSGAGGLTPLGAIGGGLSIGLGAYNLFTSKSTAGKIGGGLGMLGGAMGIAGMLMPALSALGPVGMAVGLLGSMLPMLFGGGQETPPMPPLDYGAGTIWPTGTGYGYSGSSMNGGKSMSAGAEAIGTSLKGLFAKAGLVGIAGSLIGGDIASGVNNVWSNGGWQGQAYTQIGLHTPQGYERVTYNDTSRTAEQAADLLVAKMFSANVLRGGVSGASDALKTAVTTAEPTTAKAVQDLVEFVSVYEKIGKTSNATADALKAVEEKFATLAESATRYGLSLDPINKARDDEKKKIATDFADGVQRAYKEMKDPYALALEDLEKEHDALIKTNKEILDAKIGGLDQTVTIEKLYAEKRNKIYADQVANLMSGNYDPTGWNAAGNKIALEAPARKKFQEQMAIFNADLDLMNASPMQRQIVGWGRQAGAMMQSAQDQWGYGSPEYNQASAAAARQYSLQIQAASKDFVDGLHAMVEELKSPGAASIGQLMKQRAADIATATALDGPYFDGLFRVGQNVQEAMKAWNAKIFKVADDFQFSISQGLLEFSNPLQAQINALHKDRDEALATANASNAAVQKINEGYYARMQALDAIEENNRWSVKEINRDAEKAGRALTEVEQKRVKDLLSEADLARQVSDQVGAEVAQLGYHYVSINDVTELFLQKEKALREQYYSAALGSLDDLIKRLRYGDLSGASPEARLSGVSGSYAAALAQVSANPYDQNALQRFASAGAEYSSELRSYYGSTATFYAQNADILQTAQGVNNGVRAGTATGTGGKVDPMIAAMAQQIAELTALLTAERQSRAESDEAVKDLALQVRRLVTGRQAA